MALLSRAAVLKLALHVYIYGGLLIGMTMVLTPEYMHQFNVAASNRTLALLQQYNLQAPLRLYPAPADSAALPYEEMMMRFVGCAILTCTFLHAEAVRLLGKTPVNVDAVGVALKGCAVWMSLAAASAVFMMVYRAYPLWVLGIAASNGAFALCYGWVMYPGLRGAIGNGGASPRGVKDARASTAASQAKNGGTSATKNDRKNVKKLQ